MSAKEHTFTRFAAAYNYILNESEDPDTRSWFMAQSPLPLAGVIVLYLLFVTKIGPKFMAKRSPYSLYGPIMVINIFQIIANTWLFMQTGSIIWKDSSIMCRKDSEEKKTQIELTGVAATWFYFMLKIIDLLDTIIFVLRKKSRQLSFLHIYHHVGILIIAWLAVKYYPGGGSLPIVFLNSLVHAVMYLYYTLAALGPRMTPYLWWKKYLTTMQIVQFILMLRVNFYLVHLKCSIPRVIWYTTMPYTISILILFLMFYRTSYTVNGKEVKKTE
ncbi:very long chain fatty acid elongase AAEL008004-like [Hetaerina americana]|uniref:very long chain fatty acid elongase AAEL008004-like n=1 Tax=Hetaerina americana TaxID=62018 RepID=UPI003A7F13A6